MFLLIYNTKENRFKIVACWSQWSQQTELLLFLWDVKLQDVPFTKKGHIWQLKTSTEVSKHSWEEAIKPSHKLLTFTTCQQLFFLITNIIMLRKQEFPQVTWHLSLEALFSVPFRTSVPIVGPIIKSIVGENLLSGTLDHYHLLYHCSISAWK